MEKYRATLRCQWFQCRRSSSSSGKNKLKEPLVDYDEVPFSSKRKAADAFGYCLESEGTSQGMREGANEGEKGMMNIKRRKRDCLMQHKEYDFTADEFEVVDILLNLPGNFLERVNLETSNSALNSSPNADQERVSNKTSKKTVNSGDSRCKKQTKKPVNQAAASELPQNFKNLISDMGGSKITLVIQKTLYDSDLNPQQNRLSIPSQQVKDKDFLLSTELEILEERKEIKVKLIQPSLEITELSLVKWFMHKGPKSEKVSTSYILRSNWVKIAKANKLKKNDVIQVWSFRIEEKLCMAIVKF